MRTFSQIIKDSGGATALARRIGEDPNTVHAWKRGSSIPAAHWNAIVAAELATLKELADAAAARRLAARPFLTLLATDYADDLRDAFIQGARE